jgi:two-component system, chemotaxis family, chemotaxis protein CheY
MKILFVEDSALMRRSMVKAALKSGFKTVEAENGAEALARLRKHGTSIDLVVLDWNMPVMDGLEVLTKMRSQADFQSIPVLMATSDGVEEDVKQALKAGASGYLVKPFTAEVLVKRINSILRPQRDEVV